MWTSLDRLKMRRLGPLRSLPRTSSPAISRSPGTEAICMSERDDLKVTVLAILLRRISSKKSPLRWTAPILLLVAAMASSAADAADKVSSLDVRLLSTMLTSNEGYGEWGFAALVVADGHRILFD